MKEKIFTESPYMIPIEDEEIKNFIREIPKSPGVYKFLDKFKNPLYIGKAKSLNKRIASYFRTSSRSEKIDKLFESITPAITNEISEKDDFDFHTSAIIKLLGIKGSLKTAQTLISGEFKKILG